MLMCAKKGLLQREKKGTEEIGSLNQRRRQSIMGRDGRLESKGKRGKRPLGVTIHRYKIQEENEGFYQK